MGYRYYFLKVKKEDVELVKDLSLQELKKYGSSDSNEWVDLDDVITQKEIFEFGKLYYDDTAEQIYKTGIPLFNDKETMEYFSDYIPYVVGKEGLLKVIDIYRKKIVDYYKGLLVDGETRIIPLFGFEIKNEDIKSLDKVRNDIEDKIRDWEHADKMIFSNNEEQVTKSWNYEYSIFNLLFLLKTIDWETENILFYGY